MDTRRSADWAALSEWASTTAGLSLAAGQLEQLAAYLDTLVLWNRKIALISQRDAAQIIARHIADSLFVAAHCGATDSVVDLGSGAGLPGLPIAIARPAAHVTLIESRGKKASFLEEACRTASIRNVRVVHARIEAAALDAEHGGRYAVATARALTSTKEFVALARPFLASDGCAIAMRAAHEPNALGAKEILYALPDGTQRKLLVIKGT